LALESQQARKLELEGADTLERVSLWWGQYQRIVLGALVGIVVVGAGAFFYLRTRSTQEEEASGQLAEASVLFWQGDYARSLELSKQIYGQFGGTPSGLEAHRLAGDNAFWNGDFKTAVAEYRRYLDKAKPGMLTDAARRSLAYALESDGQTLEAAKLYEELVGRLDRVSSAEFLVAAARCYRLAGQPAEAIKRLERVDQEFGDTSYAQQARVELGELRAAAAP
jgi:TolA-binding protein